MSEKKARIRELIDLLNKASIEYYSGTEEIMSDMEYDSLYNELMSLESETELIMSDSPTQKVGYEVVSSLPKVRHEVKALSLDKTKETEKLKTFLSDKTGILSWKLDGLTVILTYQDGKLARAVTRGNGEVGEDITHNAVTFKNLPLKIAFCGKLILRGECVISYDDFAKINESLPEGEKYKNPRNLCSGSIRQLDSSLCSARKVHFFAFALVIAEGKQFTLKSEKLEFLRELGFSVVQYKFVTAENIDETVAFFSENIISNKFASDGLVLTFDDIAFSDSLGATSKFPKDSIAFKWTDEIAETTLLEIEWSVSRTGLINPIAVFEPVEIEGTTVERASLHNLSIAQSLELGIGDKITVYKANMIIPQVAENITRSGIGEIPESCPVCGFTSEITESNNTKFLYCRNPNCRAKLVESLTHFTSRDAMNIDGFSVKKIEKFTEKNFLKNYLDIYYLKEHEQEISNMDGFGKKSVDNLFEAIEKSKNADAAHFIYALGISQVGLAGAKLLCTHFNYDFEKIKSASVQDLIAIEGFGESIAKSIVLYFNDKKNSALYDAAVNILNLQKPETIEGASFAGKSFVITGDLIKFENRAALQKFIEERGGKVKTSVSVKTSYLINNDPMSDSSKNKKAISLNIPIISEQYFLDMFKL